jgi:hypothetical protein
VRPSLERELVALERRLLAELRRELDARLLELERRLQVDVADLNQRIDQVHEPALRLLTHNAQKGAPNDS